MADVTGSILLFKNFQLEHFKGAVDLLNDSFLFGLSQSTWVPDIENHLDVSDVEAELAGNGYARQALTNPAVAIDGAYVKWTFDNPVFTPSGGNLQARYWWLFDDTHADDILVAWGYIDGVNLASITLVNLQPLTLHVNANGLIRGRLEAS